VGGLQNFAEVGRVIGISSSTLKRYVALLKALYLHIEIPAWHRNLEKRRRNIFSVNSVRLNEGCWFSLVVFS
jgi:predicted AAA+ superfamily ATPase